MKEATAVAAPFLDIFAEYATDETLEVEGTWVPHGPSHFKIARSGTRKYAKALTAKVDENRILLDRGDEAAEKLNEKIMIDTLAETVLVGWKNVGYQGKEMEYSVENAKILLKHRDFRRLVVSWADDASLYKAKLADDVTGN